MIIKSSSALRNDYSMISDLAHDEAEPIYITKNGEGDLRPGFDFPFFLFHEKKTSFSGCLFSWSGRRESNPQRKLGKLEFYH